MINKTLRTITVIGMLSAVGLAFVTTLHAENEKPSEESSVVRLALPPDDSALGLCRA
jgi:hypothetical protein